MNFRDQLAREIRRTILEAREAGTMGMSMECLMQCVKSPSSDLDGAPRGTNARYFYNQMFREICNFRDIQPFIL